MYAARYEVMAHADHCSSPSTPERRATPHISAEVEVLHVLASVERSLSTLDWLTED